ncbi:hypothetical protein PHYPO_G00110250 [Pangasianodon hypophthalmus]|uniref:Ig-like domain-containing protein n=1 Tax=Pangasianodon hypophthalmus TaxID=310915 RepID=A0A5N5PYE0_PANHP|nr:hypothetical protein PHYPO_G00110250 [Pangasianodon hypophthalmus]
MEKWLLKRWRLSVCLLVTFLSTAFAEVVYLHSQRNSSIEFSCVPPQNSDQLFAFSLKRDWLQKGTVLYHNFKSQPSINDPTFNDRISDQTDGNQTVSVSITFLQGYDTDVYVCVFHYRTPTGFQNLSGKARILLYVQDYHIEPCSCSSYTPLLFSLSAAGGLLFFIILVLAAMQCKKKPSRGGQTKPQLSVPIYEEMNGVREKPNSRSLEDDVSSLYVRPKKENPYIN